MHLGAHEEAVLAGAGAGLVRAGLPARALSWRLSPHARTGGVSEVWSILPISSMPMSVSVGAS